MCVCVLFVSFGETCVLFLLGERKKRTTRGSECVRACVAYCACEFACEY